MWGQCWVSGGRFDSNYLTLEKKTTIEEKNCVQSGILTRDPQITDPALYFFKNSKVSELQKNFRVFSQKLIR